jgi:hypothetical protein
MHRFRVSLGVAVNDTSVRQSRMGAKGHFGQAFIVWWPANGTSADVMAGCESKRVATLERLGEKTLLVASIVRKWVYTLSG